MKAVCTALQVARSNITARRVVPAEAPRARRPGRVDDAPVLAAVKTLLAVRPTYGYRRISRLLFRQRRAAGQPSWNHKTIYRVMKAHDLLLMRQTGHLPGPAHDGEVMVETSNTRWCSDGLEIGCANGEKVRVAFALDCCDREAIRYVATTAGISGEMVRDLMVESLEQRFGAAVANHGIEWLSDNGSACIARETRRFGTALGFQVKRTPLRSPQSNGMAEAFVKTLKRDYASMHPKPDAQSVLDALPHWIEDCNEHHPHKALKMMSPREYRRALIRNTDCPV